MPPYNPVDSHATVIGEMTFVNGSEVLQIPINDMLQSLSVEVTSDGTWFADVVLFDVTDQLEDLVLAAGINGKILFRWGWDMVGGIAGLPLYTGAITRVVPSFTHEGTQFRFGLIPDVTLAALVDRRIFDWAEGQPLSDIVTSIATARGYRTTDAKGRATIQPCNVRRGDPITTMGESDIKFIREYIVPYAVDDSGRGGFEVYVDESNALHFHNDYFRPREKALWYTAYRDTMGDVIEFTPQSDGLLAAIMGAGNTTYEGTDSDGGTATQVTTAAQSGVPDVKSEVLADANAKVDFGKKVHGRVRLDERDPDLFKSRVAHSYAMLNRLTCNARLVVKGTHAAAVNDFITVDYYRRNGSKHWLSGNFRVKKIVHTWDVTGWKTDFDLLRDGISPVPGSIATAAPITAIVRDTSETVVPGQSGNQGQAAVDSHPVADGGAARRQ